VDLSHQYISGCLNFDPQDYFKRYLANNQTVRMYTKLLSFYSTNESQTNHYAFCYLQRLCSFRLEQTHPTQARKSDTIAPPGEPEDTLTLGHLLFNVPTLTVFTAILSDTYASKQKVNQRTQ
jgi:hypothetical protein